MNEQAEYIAPRLTRAEITTGDEFKAKVTRWSWILFIICAIYQAIFFPDLTNLMMVASVAFAWAITLKAFFPSAILKSFPLSVFLIFGFTTTQLYFPLLFTTLEGKPLIYNLELPEQVFLHSNAALVVIILAHAIYRTLLKITYTRSFSILEKTGFFTPPTDTQVWLMGLIGMAAMYYVYFMNPDVGSEVTGSASDKFVQGFLPFTYAPYFIPFGKLYGRKNQTFAKHLIPMLLVFTGILLALSIGRNTTSSFMFGFTAVGYAYLLGLLLGIFKAQVISVKNIFMGAIAVWLLVYPLADLRTAMVLVRGERREVPAEELIGLTMDTFFDKEALRERRLEDITEEHESGWDERYLDNVFTARFANIKFNDASLIRAEMIDNYDPYMQEYCLDFTLGQLPDPFLKALNIDVDKEIIFSTSIGDYLYIVSGGAGVASGFRTGHISGTGMATFGWWYLGLLGIGMIPVFYLVDRFAKKKSISNAIGQPSSQQLLFSFCGLLALTEIFGFLRHESVIMLASFLIRGWFQIALLYFVMFQLTQILSGGFLRRVKFSDR